MPNLFADKMSDQSRCDTGIILDNWIFQNQEGRK